MAGRKGDGWMKGRTKHIRVYLTEEEYEALRYAAFLAKKSLSRYAVEAINRIADQESKKGKRQ